MPNTFHRFLHGIHSVRNRLLLVAVLPFLILLPLLLGLIQIWGAGYYDRLLTFKVNSDLAVAHQYFKHVVERVGSDVSALGSAHTLITAIEQKRSPDLQRLLASRKRELGIDFLVFRDAQGNHLSSTHDLSPSDKTTQTKEWPVVSAALIGTHQTAIDIFSAEQLNDISPELANRAYIKLVETTNASPTQSGDERRGMVIHAAAPVVDAHGHLLGVLEGGVLLNQNLDFVDTINNLVYSPGSLPLGSEGTATLFIDDVRIATNVRLFADKRALGTRASAKVRDYVLAQNKTWLDRAFVVHDWYISAYEPILDSFNHPVGMLYVGYLEAPFNEAKQQVIIWLIFLFVLICGAGILFSLRLARAIYQPIEVMNATMHAVQHGQFEQRSGYTDGADELATLSGHLDELLDTVHEQNAELKAWGESLDVKVSERTAELEQANRLLRDAQRQLALSEKLAAIGEITAGVAHEINNPVAVLQGNLDVVRDSLGNAAHLVADELRLMDQQIHRINLLVTKLLQFASPTEYAGYTEQLTLDSVVSDSLVLTQHLISKSGIQVNQRNLATHYVNINRNELQQVLINLISNAIHAMEEYGVLHLDCEDLIDQNGIAGVAIHVTDNGVGINQDNLPKVFDAFFTTRPGKGTGLGLSISYTLVARYGGKITVTSELGVGTVFTVWLPAA